MGFHRGSPGILGSASSDQVESAIATSLTLVSADADAGYPTMEYTNGRITLFSGRQNVLIVEYVPDRTADVPPLDVCDWALILADDAGTVLASGIITHTKMDFGDIRRYHLTLDQEGPAPPGHPWS
jgi:hypothetical protein